MFENSVEKKVSANLRRASELHISGEITRAEELLKRIVCEFDSNNAEAHWRLGLIYHVKGDIERALREYRLAARNGIINERELYYDELRAELEDLEDFSKEDLRNFMKEISSINGTIHPVAMGYITNNFDVVKKELVGIWKQASVTDETIISAFEALKGTYATPGLISNLLFLKDKDKYNICTALLTKALEAIGKFPEGWRGDGPSYLAYNSAINEFRVSEHILPEAVDWLLTQVGRVEEDVDPTVWWKSTPKTKSSGNAWPSRLGVLWDISLLAFATEEEALEPLLGSRRFAVAIPKSLVTLVRDCSVEQLRLIFREYESVTTAPQVEFLKSFFTNEENLMRVEQYRIPEEEAAKLYFDIGKPILSFVLERFPQLEQRTTDLLVKTYLEILHAAELGKPKSPLRRYVIALFGRAKSGVNRTIEVFQHVGRVVIDSGTRIWHRLHPSLERYVDAKRTYLREELLYGVIQSALVQGLKLQFAVFLSLPLPIPEPITWVGTTAVVILIDGVKGIRRLLRRK